MSISVITSATGVKSATAGTTFTIALSSTAKDDVFVAVVSSGAAFGASSCTDTNGGAYDKYANLTNTVNVSLYKKRNASTATGGTLTITMVTGGFAAGVAVSVRNSGWNGTPQVTITGTSGSPSTGSLALAEPTGWVLTALGLAGNNALTANTGTIENQVGTTNAYCAIIDSQGAAGPVTNSATTTSSAWAMISIQLMPFAVTTDSINNWLDLEQNDAFQLSSLADSINNWQDSIQSSSFQMLKLAESINNWNDFAQNSIRTLMEPVSDSMTMSDGGEICLLTGGPSSIISFNFIERIGVFWQDSINLYKDPIGVILSDDNSPNWQDNLSSNANPSTVLTDSMSMSDAFVKLLQPGIGLQDIITTWQDLILSEFFPGYDLRDTMSMNEAFTKALVPSVQVFDTLSMSDSLILGIGLAVRSEQLNHLDSIQYIFSPSAAQFVDVMKFTDSIQTLLNGILSPLHLSDALVFSDAFKLGTSGGLALPNLADQMVMSDATPLLFITANNGGGTQLDAFAISDGMLAQDSLRLFFSGTPVITSAGAPGNVTVELNGNTIGLLSVSGNEILFLDPVYQYANLDLPYSPNDPGLTFAYNNSNELAQSIPLFARFFNLLMEPSTPIPVNMGANSSSTSTLCYNVQDFGALGDGTTNDTAAIQTALDKAHDNYINSTVNGTITGPTKVCIPAGLVCIVGGGFWVTPQGLSWPTQPGAPGAKAGAAFPQLGGALTLVAFLQDPTQQFGGSAVDGSLFVKSGVTVQVDGTVRLAATNQFGTNRQVESSIFCFYDNSFTLQLPGPADCAPQQASIVGTGTLDGNSQNMTSAFPGLGAGVYANVGDGSDFLCSGITVINTANFGIVIDGNINDSTVFSGAQVSDCTCDTIGDSRIAGGPDQTIVWTGIVVFANGVQVSRNKIRNCLQGTIINTFGKAMYIAGQQITVSNNLINNCIGGIFIGLPSQLGFAAPPYGGAYLVKINQNTIQGLGLQLNSAKLAGQGFPTDPTQMSDDYSGIILAAVLARRNSPNGVLNYVNGIDIGDNTIAQCKDGIVTDFYNSGSTTGPLENINIHDNNCNNNYGYGIWLESGHGSFINVSVWGNMLQNDTLGGINVNGNIDAAAITSGIPGIGSGTTPGAPGTINTGGTPVTGDPGIYELAFYSEGSPLAGEEVLRWTAARTVTFLQNFAGSTGSCDVNPASTVTYSVLQGGTQVGTISIAPTGVFTFTTSGVIYNLGSVMKIVAPTPADAILAGVSFVLVGTRST